MSLAVLDAPASRHRTYAQIRDGLAGKPLTRIELMVLDRLADGLSRAQAGRELHLAPLTVKTHLRRMGLKTGICDQAGLVGYAYRKGLLVRRPGVAPVQLGEREFQVVQGVARGLSNEEIGAELDLSVDTVKWHLRRAMVHLGACTRVQAVRRAVDTGALPLVSKGAPS